MPLDRKSYKTLTEWFLQIPLKIQSVGKKARQGDSSCVDCTSRSSDLVFTGVLYNEKVLTAAPGRKDIIEKISELRSTV